MEVTAVELDVKYQQIFVEPTDGLLQVTFDDNKTSNYWGYHQGANYPHITGYWIMKFMSLEAFLILKMCGE